MSLLVRHPPSSSSWSGKDGLAPASRLSQSPLPNPGLPKCAVSRPGGLCPPQGLWGGLELKEQGRSPAPARGVPAPARPCWPSPASPPPCHPASSRLVAIRGQLLEQSCSVFLQGLFLGEMNPASGKSPWRERCGSSLGTDWETRVTAHQPQKRLLCDFWATLSRRCEPGPRFSGK